MPASNTLPLTILADLTDTQIDEIVEFLETLTDDRVVKEKAPFDHPQLFVPNGALMAGSGVAVDTDGSAKDNLMEVKAVGRNGGGNTKGFLE